ncbi:MAG TPA: glycosyltransferase family 2 protein [Candidatus Limosilactobacillus faecipullorum]|nr:glycosyltransferase family 2 protein [Candidatus Limosilactobacillus faecipullorum]
MTPVLTIIVPCYNEAAVLELTAQKLQAELQALINQHAVAPTSKILFVDDGSQDQTWSLIQKLQANQACFTGLKFSRNFGHQNAVLAGLATAVNYADWLITIDADLQDDVTKIPEMVSKAANGYEIIYGVRNNRATDTAFKRSTANCFYWGMRKLGVELIPNHADYRLMSKRAVYALLQYHETNLFLRGLVPTLGFKSTKVFYQRHERAAGQSHYPLKKMLALAINGLTSFSIAPIQLILYLGLLMMVVSGLALLYVLGSYFWYHTASGWASVMMSLWFLGGLQLVTLSIVGTYVGKTFVETKHRPRYLIETNTFPHK